MEAKIWSSTGVLSIPLTTFEDEKTDRVPGTPVADYFTDIATRLKEVEADRLRDIQAAEIPEEKN